MGVESVWQPSLDLIRKRIDLDQARRTIATLKEVGIEPRIYMILGLPGEPEDIVERTWSFVQETAPDLVILSLFTVRPGTEVFDDHERFGIAQVEKDWRKTMHMYGRYDDELPTLTFHYKPEGPLGKTLTNQQIIENYQELQRRLKEVGLSSLPYYKTVDDF
ncbi:MAG: radical SAM protein [Alphaproteobacteria bacterium]|nr:radical SAM protein [Alphaproteobacteria bacterium]